MPTTYAIPNGATQFAATLYTGNGTSQTVTNGASTSGTTFQPDFVWGKNRSTATSNVLVDSVRGATNFLQSNSTAQETTNAQVVSAFTSTGFSVGNDATLNGSTNLEVAWQWKAGGTAVTNTSGSISSQVSANPTAGFSIVTYTGTGANATVGHGLSNAPKMVIIFNRTTGFAYSHPVWHSAFITASNTDYMYLNETISKGASGAAQFWNSTVPSPTVISIGTDLTVNRSTNNYVAYCWSEIDGYSKFGSYVGNGAASNGTFVYLGFRPRFLMVKSSTLAGTDWAIWDTSRDPSNIVNFQIIANGATTSTTPTADIDILSNGFKAKRAGNNFNASGATYIYMAFAENPFKYANAR